MGCLLPYASSLGEERGARGVGREQGAVLSRRAEPAWDGERAAHSPTEAATALSLLCCLFAAKSTRE